MANKMIGIVLVICLVFLNISLVFAEDNEDLKELLQIGKTVGDKIIENSKGIIEDIKELTDIGLHWAKDYIEKLIDLDTINGYPDGTFKPDHSITNAEFTKILLSSMEYKFENSEEGHWSKNYIDKALSLGIIDEDDFKDLDAPITRGQMAKMIVRSVPTEKVDNLLDYQHQIKDIDEMTVEMKYYVTTAYGLGIITGYEDGTFRPDRTATRAEASTMVVRMINKEERSIPKLSRKWTHKEFMEFLKKKGSWHTVSTEYFEVIEEGKLRFLPNSYGLEEKIITNESKFPNLNSITYNIVKDLTQLASEGGYYVKVFYHSIDEDSIVVTFFEEERVARGGHHPEGVFNVVLRVEPFKPYEETKDLSYVTVDLSRLWRMQDAVNIGDDYIEENNNRHHDFLRGFRDMMYNIYGEENGQLLYEYALKEYDEEYKVGASRENYSLLYIGDIEVRNFNLTGINVHFTTNIKR